jgi:hypothetical protein
MSNIIMKYNKQYYYEILWCYIIKLYYYNKIITKYYYFILLTYIIKLYY